MAEFEKIVIKDSSFECASVQGSEDVSKVENVEIITESDIISLQRLSENEQVESIASESTSDSIKEPELKEDLKEPYNNISENLAIEEKKADYYFQPGTKTINWLSGNIKQLNSEIDILTYEGSINRLLIGGFILTFICILVTTILVWQYCRLLTLQDEYIKILKVSDKIERKTPVLPQIMKIMKTEQIIQLEFDPKTGTATEKIIFQLQYTAKRHYFAAIASPADTIHFIRDDALAHVTKYQPFHNQHRIIPKSKITDAAKNEFNDEGYGAHDVWHYIKSVQVNDKLWMFFKRTRKRNAQESEFSFNVEIGTRQIETILWYTKKGSWGYGPRLPFAWLDIFNPLNLVCSLALDKYRVLFIGRNEIDGIETLKFFIYDIHMKKWTHDYEALIIDGYIIQSSSIVQFSKNYEKFIILAVSNIPKHHNVNAHPNLQPRSDFYKSDFTNGFTGSWTHLASHDTTGFLYVSTNDMLVSYRGMTLSFYNHKTMPGCEIGLFFQADWSYKRITYQGAPNENCSLGLDEGPIQSFKIYLN